MKATALIKDIAHHGRIKMRFHRYEKFGIVFPFFHIVVSGETEGEASVEYSLILHAEFLRFGGIGEMDAQQLIVSGIVHIVQHNATERDPAGSLRRPD